MSCSTEIQMEGGIVAMGTMEEGDVVVVVEEGARTDPGGVVGMDRQMEAPPE